MNKKLFYGATAVSVVAIGGYLYYRHHRDQSIDKLIQLFREDDTEDETLNAPEEGAWNPDVKGFPDEKEEPVHG